MLDIVSVESLWYHVHLCLMQYKIIPATNVGFSLFRISVGMIPCASVPDTIYNYTLQHPMLDLVSL